MLLANTWVSEVKSRLNELKSRRHEWERNYVRSPDEYSFHHGSPSPPNRRSSRELDATLALPWYSRVHSEELRLAITRQQRFANNIESVTPSSERTLFTHAAAPKSDPCKDLAEIEREYLRQSRIDERILHLRKMNSENANIGFGLLLPAAIKSQEGQVEIESHQQKNDRLNGKGIHLKQPMTNMGLPQVLAGTGITISGNVDNVDRILVQLLSNFYGIKGPHTNADVFSPAAAAPAAAAQETKKNNAERRSQLLCQQESLFQQRRAQSAVELKAPIERRSKVQRQRLQQILQQAPGMTAESETSHLKDKEEEMKAKEDQKQELINQVLKVLQPQIQQRIEEEVVKKVQAALLDIHENDQRSLQASHPEVTISRRNRRDVNRIKKKWRQKDSDENFGVQQESVKDRSSFEFLSRGEQLSHHESPVYSSFESQCVRGSQSVRGSTTGEFDRTVSEDISSGSDEVQTRDKVNEHQDQVSSLSLEPLVSVEVSGSRLATPAPFLHAIEEHTEDESHIRSLYESSKSSSSPASVTDCEASRSVKQFNNIKNGNKGKNLLGLNVVDALPMSLANPEKTILKRENLHYSSSDFGELARSAALGRDQKGHYQESDDNEAKTEIEHVDNTEESDQKAKEPECTAVNEHLNSTEATLPALEFSQSPTKKSPRGRRSFYRGTSSGAITQKPSNKPLIMLSITPQKNFTFSASFDSAMLESSELESKNF